MDAKPPHDDSDGSADPISALADQIADRVVVKLGMRLGARPATEQSRPAGLWTTRQVAAHYDVGVGFVYQHADELGCIRLGAGRRPRLRFDPRIVRERWPLVGDTLPEPARTTRRAGNTNPRRGRAQQRTYELIEYEQP